MDFIFYDDVNAAINYLRDDILSELNQHNNYDLDLTGLLHAHQKTAIRGVTEALRAFNNRVYGNKYLVLRVQYDSIDGVETEFMRVINNQTIQHLQHLLDWLNGTVRDTTADFTESDEAILMGLVFPKKISLEWYEFKKPKKAGGYWPYYNLNRNIDLSMFGIYRQDQITDTTYKDNCFIKACISSKLFTDTEIELMRSLINTRWLPRDDLVYFADLFNCCISISYYNDEFHKINKAVKYGNKSAPKMLRLLLRAGHYMLYNDNLVPANKYNVKNLNMLLTKMLLNGEFEPITDFDVAEKFIAHEYEYEHLEYTPFCCKPVECNIKHDSNGYCTAIFVDNKFQLIASNKIFNIDPSQLFNKLPDRSVVYMPDLKDILAKIPTSDSYKISSTQFHNTVQQIRIRAINAKKIVWLRSFKALTAIDYTTNQGSDFNRLVKGVRQILTNTLKINLDDFNSLPSLSFKSAIQYGCFDGVYQLSGIVQAFAKRCIKGGLIRTLYDNCFEVDDTTCLDINSSYGTSMSSMQGIPRGCPKPFYNEIPIDSCYAFIQCEISNIRSDKLGRYGFITNGVNFIDSVLLGQIRKYVDCDVRIINGYSFNEGFNTKIREFVKVLYDLRSIAWLNKFGKNMLSCLYGKSLQSSAQFKYVVVPKNEIHEYLAEHGNWIFEVVKRSNCYLVKLLRSLNSNYNIPQLGVQVLSESRARMNDIIIFCNRNDIPIYSIKTDCFVIDSNNVDAFSKQYPIGRELGQLKIEYQAKHVKFTSASCYRAELTDGSIRMRGVIV